MSATFIDNPHPVLSPDDPLLTLAPTDLRNHRKPRYQGDDLCVELPSLAARDQTLVRRLYEVLNELLRALTDTATNDEGKWREVVFWSQRHDLDVVIDEVREIGLASREHNSGERFAQAMHDVRGGGLSPLLGRLQLLGHLREPRPNSRPCSS